jgi:hypothetical protein
MEEMKNAFKIFVGKIQGVRRLGKPRQEDNIRIDLKEIIGWEDVDWMRLAQDRDQ